MVDELAIIQNMVQHPIVMVAVLYKVSSEEETEYLFLDALASLDFKLSVTQ